MKKDHIETDREVIETIQKFASYGRQNMQMNTLLIVSIMAFIACAAKILQIQFEERADLPIIIFGAIMGAISLVVVVGCLRAKRQIAEASMELGEPLLNSFTLGENGVSHAWVGNHPVLLPDMSRQDMRYATEGMYIAGHKIKCP